MNLNKTSAWSEAEISSFLTDTAIPVRIATSTDSYPTLCSVWYMLDEKNGDLLCVSHQNSQLVSDLMANEKCSFEIAPNEPPYHGVRESSGHAFQGSCSGNAIHSDSTLPG
jgi:hypothetical protein